MISRRISDDIPPQMKILNMVIPILMHFCSFVSNWSIYGCHTVRAKNKHMALVCKMICAFAVLYDINRCFFFMCPIYISEKILTNLCAR